MGRRPLPAWLSTSLTGEDEDRPTVRMCPRCGAASKVYDTRRSRTGAIVRRRTCPKCWYTWRTIEIMIDDPLIAKEEK